jgi:hypothetical protein
MAGLHEMKSDAAYPAAFTADFCNALLIFDANKVQKSQTVELGVGWIKS